MAHRIAVVVSQGQSHNPKKRAMEEEIVANLLSERGIDVTVVPHLYDLKPEGTGMLCLSGVTGDLVVCSWLYPRAIRWILDRNDIWGHHGKTLLKSAGESEEEEEDADQQVEDEQDLSENDKLRVLDERELPNRKIYCLDLRAYDSATPFLEEIRRIAADQTTNTVELMNWIEGQDRTTVQSESETDSHTVFRTRWMMFQDDFYVETGCAENTTWIQVHSKSRLGLGDMGVNQERINSLVDYLSTVEFESHDC